MKQHMNKLQVLYPVVYWKQITIFTVSGFWLLPLNVNIFVILIDSLEYSYKY